MRRAIETIGLALASGALLYSPHLLLGISVIVSHVAVGHVVVLLAHSLNGLRIGVVCSFGFRELNMNTVIAFAE